MYQIYNTRHPMGLQQHLNQGRRQWKGAFLTPEGLFEPTVMFFGLTNSPATFQTMMNAIFRNEVGEGWLSVYMDDMAIHMAKLPHETEEQHTQRHHAYVH